MKIIATELPGVLVVEPRVFGDARGYFLETFQAERYRQAGIDAVFIQDNLSFSRRGILRGLHYQLPRTQSKLVQVLSGEVFDVAVDIRLGSPHFGRWAGVTLSGNDHRQLYIPAGFAHGFCVLSDTALFAYKCDDYYAPQHEGGIHWADPEIGIGWPIRDPILSDRDSAFPTLSEIASERLPPYKEI